MPDEQVLAEAKEERIGGGDNAIFTYKNWNSGSVVCHEGLCIPTYTKGVHLFLDALLHAEDAVLNDVKQIERVGFKTVLAKGYYGTHRLTPDVLEAMRKMLVVAPAHNGPYLEAIAQLADVFPDAMLIGAFETEFHTTIPLERRICGIPYDWYETYGIQRLGFHGASHRYIADTIVQQEGATGKLISCHLGGSCSLCAIVDGKSADTSFGFSPQTGICHANRTGDLDAYVIPYLLQEGLLMEDILTGLEKEGGLFGISGISNDLREITEAIPMNARAKLALESFCNEIVKYIGAFYAEMGGLDHLTFTGGIGENSALVRKKVCEGLAHLGILLNEEKNCNPVSDPIISSPSSPVKIHVIPANEELVVARKTFHF